jgi:hypothetical protein
MLAVQHRLSLVRPRMRSSARRPFCPSQDTGCYRLPHEVRDRLAASLAPFRNRDAAFALAVFLARFWSAPGRVVGSFPIDRRALAHHRDLDLTEARVRGAIRTLEEVGFLDRAITSGSAYKPTPDGLHRKPILYVFGAEFAPAFIAANKRATAAHDARRQERRAPGPDATRRPPVALPGASVLKSPKSKSEASPVVIMGDLVKGCRRQSLPSKAEPDSRLEAALERWRKAFEEDLRK